VDSVQNARAATAWLCIIQTMLEHDFLAVGRKGRKIVGTCAETNRWLIFASSPGGKDSLLVCFILS